MFRSKHFVHPTNAVWQVTTYQVTAALNTGSWTKLRWMNQRPCKTTSSQTLHIRGHHHIERVIESVPVGPLAPWLPMLARFFLKPWIRYGPETLRNYQGLYFPKWKKGLFNWLLLKAYLPNLADSEFHLFRNVKKDMAGKPCPESHLHWSKEKLYRNLNEFLKKSTVPQLPGRKMFNLPSYLLFLKGWSALNIKKKMKDGL